MNLLKMSLYGGILALSLSPEVLGFKQRESTQLTSLQETPHNIDPTEFPLFPEEKEIKDFPQVLEEDEADPEVLAEYYEAVAKSYTRWAEEQQGQARQAALRVQGHQEALLIKASSTSSSSFYSWKSDPIARARSSAVYNSKMSYHPAALKGQISQEKAQFYQELSDTWKVVNAS